ncbi:putative RNA helicase SDE3 [Sesamum alatum]|uniref:RNA helicase SDE3 n=1 Tax=Sesamum alatum TaxID=300844 RepID=A0AAE1YAW6_9LAMI|nr:putative RNA helicase SDE3 [Sesamum alatum]
MSTIHDKSDDEYSIIGDKGDIGFIDFENFKSLCSYNPSEESQIVNISVPFPLVGKNPHVAFVGERLFDSITIENTTGERLDLWSTPDVITEDLTKRKDGSFFKTLLAMEEIKLEEYMRAYNMECVTMKSKRNQFLFLEVPGLAEKSLPLLMGTIYL